MKKAFVLPVVAIAMAVMIVVIASLVILGVRESFDVTQDRFRKLSLAAAEAGVARAQTYIQQNWNTLISGTIPSGYKGDVVYTHTKGDYKIWLSTSSESYGDAIVAVVSGRYTLGNSTSIRTVELKYSRNKIDEALNVGTMINWKPNMIIHWAPAISYGNMKLDGSQTSTYWPRRFAVGYIDPWDTNPSPPNEDSTKNYYAFQTDLEKPTIDLEYYKAKAKETRLIEAAISNWNSLSNNQKKAISKYQYTNANYTGSTRPEYAGTGYFPANRATEEVRLDDYFGLFYSSHIIISSGDAVIYIETKDDPDDTTLKFQDTPNKQLFLRLGAIVNLGNIHYHADGISTYTVSVPTKAWKEYTSGTVLNPTSPDSVAQDEYPGDGGYRTVKPQFTIIGHSGGPGGGHAGDTCIIIGLNGLKGTAFHGFLYTLRFKCSGGNQALVGSVFVDRGQETETGEAQMNTIAVFYDSDVAENIKYKEAKIKLRSYNELTSIW